MIHREKDFWLYLLAYLWLGTAFVAIVLGIIDMTIFGRKAELGAAALGLFGGTLLLSSINRRKPDNPNGDRNPLN